MFKNHQVQHYTPTKLRHSSFSILKKRLLIMDEANYQMGLTCKPRFRGAISNDLDIIVSTHMVKTFHLLSKN